MPTLGALMLRVDGITAGYGPVTILRDLSFQAEAGQVTCIMGRNGAGKSTLMRAIMGLVPVQSGQITLEGVPLHTLPAHKVPGQGVAYVPQGRRLFGPLTVAENIEVGLLTRKKGLRTREFVLDLFPRLRERLDQVASTLSGGEQQMLAIARALCLEPQVLLLDEPSEGLQPSMIALIRDTVLRLRETGLATVLVEQRVDTVLRMADRVAFMSHGQVEQTVAREGLSSESTLFQQYVGV
jgi:branched-chain amino acid transport system ATP-binding protein